MAPAADARNALLSMIFIPFDAISGNKVAPANTIGADIPGKIEG